MRVKRGGGGGFEASLSLWFTVLVESSTRQEAGGRNEGKERKREGKREEGEGGNSPEEE